MNGHFCTTQNLFLKKMYSESKPIRINISVLSILHPRMPSSKNAIFRSLSSQSKYFSKLSHSHNFWIFQKKMFVGETNGTLVGLNFPHMYVVVFVCTNFFHKKEQDFKLLIGPLESIFKISKLESTKLLIALSPFVKCLSHVLE